MITEVTFVSVLFGNFSRNKPNFITMPAGLCGVLHNHDSLTLLSFSSYIGVKDSNEAEILAIHEALKLYKVSFNHPLIVESDSLNAISWVTNLAKGPWRFYFYLNEIKSLSSQLEVEFRHILHSANEEADVLAKRGVAQQFVFFALFPCNFLFFFVLGGGITVLAHLPLYPCM